MRARQQTDPHQPENKGIQHNQGLPEIEMCPLKYLVIPLSKVKQGYDSDQVQGLDGHKAQDQADELMLPGCRKGQNGRCQDYHGLHPVAPRLDAHGKIIGDMVEDDARGHHPAVKEPHNPGAECGQSGGKGLNHGPSNGMPEFQGEEHALYGKKKDKEFKHGS